MFKEIIILIKKEFQNEWKQKFSFSGILLYVISTVFVSYLCFKVIDNILVWNALFWIIMLFAATNAVAKSFIQESKGRLLYLYTLSSPQGIIIAKTIYNSILLSIIGLFNYVFFGLLLGDLVQDKLLFLITVFLGSMGFAIVLTMVSAIASKTNNTGSLMAILAFPILIPFLITLIRLSKNSLDGLDFSVSYSYIIILLAINVIVVVLAYLLFPYLWRD
ncbi:MAG: heme exporter protein CcmB [Bacteroidia bacterium]